MMSCDLFTWFHVSNSNVFTSEKSRYMMSKQTMVLSIFIEQMQIYCSVNAKLLSSPVKYKKSHIITSEILHSKDIETISLKSNKKFM